LSKFASGDAILNGARALGYGTQAMAIGSGIRLPAPSAGLVNGVLVRGLDFDDTRISAVYHATSPALAAALAAGEANGSTGAEVLVAFTRALEIGCRLATVGAGAFHDRAFHPTSLCGADLRLGRSTPSFGGDGAVHGQSLQSRGHVS